MKVKDLIKFLETQDPEMTVVHQLYSDRCLFNDNDIEVIEACEEIRPDGWVQNKRPDKPTVKYLCFPGN